MVRKPQNITLYSTNVRLDDCRRCQRRNEVGCRLFDCSLNVRMNVVRIARRVIRLRKQARVLCHSVQQQSKEFANGKSGKRSAKNRCSRLQRDERERERPLPRYKRSPLGSRKPPPRLQKRSVPHRSKRENNRVRRGSNLKPQTSAVTNGKCSAYAPPESMATNRCLRPSEPYTRTRRWTKDGGRTANARQARPAASSRDFHANN